MSRLIKVFVKPVLFRLANDSGPGCIPIFRDHVTGTAGELPEGGVYCQFVTAHQDPTRPLIKIIYEETIGWIMLEQVEKIFEIDFDQNGEIIETLIFSYPSND